MAIKLFGYNMRGENTLRRFKLKLVYNVKRIYIGADKIRNDSGLSQ